MWLCAKWVIPNLDVIYIYIYKWVIPNLDLIYIYIYINFEFDIVHQVPMVHFAYCLLDEELEMYFIFTDKKGLTTKRALPAIFGYGYKNRRR